MNPLWEIQLPASKSIAQRYMLIGAVVCDDYYLNLRHHNNDLTVIANALSSTADTIDVNDSGTALRLLTAYYATTPFLHKITGTERLRCRPIQPLIDALTTLGATITNTWPMTIKGPLEGGKVTIDTTQSSQFVTALMLIAPILPKGLDIHVIGKENSTPYIQLTEAVMKSCGVRCKRDGRHIIIPHQTYQLPHNTIEADWSAAAFFYETIALHPKQTLRLKNLFQHSWQGDAVVQHWFEPLGVTTTFVDNDVVLTATQPKEIRPQKLDFTHAPDLFPAMVATLCAKQIPFESIGLCNLKHKESNRLIAMEHALRQLGFAVTVDEEIGAMSYDGTWQKPSTTVEVDGCNDHRIVMALAPISTLITMKIKGENAVGKSFPDFWNQFNKLR
ncbi:MAG: hypothetical protein Q4D14_05340 [Bacteroidales bacterium]|nr:hypothetical protein [Bacteroidales bacterium]